MIHFLEPSSEALPLCAWAAYNQGVAHRIVASLDGRPQPLTRVATEVTCPDCLEWLHS